MMARGKMMAPGSRQFLFILAGLQLIAWAGDITEDLYLLKWLKRPSIGDEFGFYHIIVYAKWIISLAGFIIAVSVLISKWKIKMKKTLFFI
jgi:hypothetical protein